MNICHVNLARGFSGGERQTLLLIKQQLREGLKLVVVARQNSPFAKEVEKLPCQLITTRHWFTHHKRNLHKVCDLIHVHEGQAVYWALIQNLLYGCPYIITRRIDNPLKNKYFSNLAYRRASALVGLSTEIIKVLQSTHRDKKCVKIPSSPVKYPVNQNKVDQIWSAHGYKFLVMQAANLLKHKGFDVTLKAARILQDQGSEVHFLLLGSGPEKEALQAQAQGLNNVSFMGKQNDMGTWFASANLFIHPSYTEGLGSVILEAMAAGLPVIGTRAGGIPDIIEDEQTGLLIKPGDAEALASGIKRITESESLRKQLLVGAREKLKDFDIARTTSLYIRLYQEIAAKHIRDEVSI
jgi:glycosyltransferase involved in cell wall biosynthesis